MRNRHKFTFIISCLIADLLAIGIGVVLFLNFAKDDAIDWNKIVLDNIMNVAIVSWIICSLFLGLYRLDRLFGLEAFYRTSWRTFLLYCIFWQAYFLAFQGSSQYHIGIKANLLMLSLLLFYFLISRIIFTIIITNLKRWQKQMFNVAIWGFNKTSIQLASQLEINNYSINFLGIVDDTSQVIYKSKKAFSAALSKAIDKASTQNIQELYVVAPPHYIIDLKKYFELADNYCMRLKFVPDFSMISTAQISTSNFDNFHVIKPRHEPLQDAYNRLTKRAFDIVFSLLVIVFVMSWLYPIIGLIIKKQSKGPIIFKQLRTGKKNESFWCYKFRSMKMNGISDSQQAQKGDQRVTAIGKFIRRTSIDELPQFVNVLFGDMSVVGPRPHMLKHTKDYNDLISNFMVRHFVKPGITGLAQVSGYRGETKKVSDMKRRVNADIDYLQNWSLIKDLKICALTIIIALKGDENAF